MAMIRLQLKIELEYTVLEPGADFFFCIHAANTPGQTVSHEFLTVSQTQAYWETQYRSQNLGERCLRLEALPGHLLVSYQATVDICHHVTDPALVAEVPVRQLPLDVLHYIYPSRYCQSDRLYNFAVSQFGHLLQGHVRAQAICDWVESHVSYRHNSSVGTTSALDTLIERVGVCRDFAHLMIALCRAVNLPARFVTGTNYGSSPHLSPPDFHAYVEVYLGHRWYLFDPSGTAIPMGMMRLATGRDAADVAFATIFGSVMSEQPRVEVHAIEDRAHGWEHPTHTSMALSTS